MKKTNRALIAVLLSLVIHFGLAQSGMAEPNPTPPPVGKLVNTLDLVAHYLTSDPGRHQIYASITGQNEIAVINTFSLNVTKTIPIGSGPGATAISPDGNILYVALTGATEVARINLNTLQTTTPLAIAGKPTQVKAGLGNRLYVITSDGDVLQLDATTGATEATLPSSNYSGALEISPDRQTLYYGDTGLSPSTLRRYDISTATPALEQTSAFDTVGENGESLKISHDGTMLCYPNGAGNSSIYQTDVIDPANFTVRYGSFDIGAYPGALTFSPDDKIAYEYRDSQNVIFLFDTSTYLATGTIYVAAEATYGVSDLVTDGSGRYLFVATESEIEIFDVQTDSFFLTTGDSFSYQVPIDPSATSSSASGLPPGVSYNQATHTISGTPTKDGAFSVVITVKDGGNTSTIDITLSIFPHERAQNISTRGIAGMGSEVLIAGFIVSGADDEEIVVRAIGPSLPVNGRLQDPVLELHDSTGARVAYNDNWMSDTESAKVSSHHLQPSDSREAALYRVLAPGAYTAIVSGVDNTPGIALAEVYDVGSQGKTGVGTSRLANISTRGEVGTGPGVMIGGVIVGGTDLAKVLIRALGPSLTSAGVSGALANPELTLYDSQGTKIAYNNNWGDTQRAAIAATGLAPTDPRESAIDITLAPAAYTAIVSGLGGTSGVGLVEVYNLP